MNMKNIHASEGIFMFQKWTGIVEIEKQIIPPGIYGINQEGGYYVGIPPGWFRICAQPTAPLRIYAHEHCISLSLYVW